MIPPPLPNAELGRVWGNVPEHAGMFLPYLPNTVVDREEGHMLECAGRKVSGRDGESRMGWLGRGKALERSLKGV